MKLVIDVRLEYDHKPLTGQVIVEDWCAPKPPNGSATPSKDQQKLFTEPPPGPWQEDPATEGQLAFMDLRGIAHTSGISKGQASKLIDAYKMTNGDKRVQTFSPGQKPSTLPSFYGAPVTSTILAQQAKVPVIMPSGTEELLPWEQEEKDKEVQELEAKKKHSRGGARPGAGRPKGSTKRKGDTI